MGEPRMAKPNWQCPNEGSEWSEWLAAGLHARNRWRLPVLLVGILFARGRRTVTTWLRAAGISDDFADYYYFLASGGRNTESVATRLLALVLGIVAGSFAALRKNSLVDRFVMSLAMTGISVPVFVVAPVTVLVRTWARPSAS